MTFDPDVDYRSDPVAALVEKLQVERDRVGALLEALGGLSEQDRAASGWPAHVELLGDALPDEDTETARE